MPQSISTALTDVPPVSGWVAMSFEAFALAALLSGGKYRLKSSHAGLY
jgi:hypothetical protein